MRIVVVGGDVAHIAGVASELAEHDLEWRLDHVSSDADVPAAGSADAPDVIVCASRVGASAGLPVLAGLYRRHPDAMRILLVAPDGDHDLFDALTNSHRILNEPLDSLALIDAVESVAELRTLLDDPALKSAIERVGTLPAAPRQYLALTTLLRDPDSTAAKIAEVVSQDPTVAARVLRLSNSAYYSGGREITDLRSAVTRLGHNTLRQLVLASEVFSAGPEADELRERALRISQLAGKLLAGPSADLATTAGLLAEVGLLLPRTAIDPSTTSYSTTGAYLLGLWGLPAPIVEAVAFHDRPSRVRGSFWVTGAVHVAAALVNGREPDEAYLRSVGQYDRLPRWREMARASTATD
ncbi:HDOD domain-containing protein [Luteimonas kalidii]|uniref:HDOD domain-containing protein n=1 Tax=Luteimonas kalidii TaxID=3042025 RepID=A0ABT6JQ53_9GAMM|nr:HDOD domain-containing protein [Luteimonas kalidii]MDH5832632.1 HDOD domain-containing protein [Luteimonas kalidii]